ncbi:MAG: HU family DNA-binding protein [Ornithinimicrobium sp.]
MNKADLIERVAPSLGGRANATKAIEVIVDAILREVAEGGSVGITGFGTFERIDRAPRTGRNPRTGAPVPIEATSAPRFRPGTYFKNVVNDASELPTEGLAGVRAGNGNEQFRNETSHFGRESTSKSA